MLVSGQQQNGSGPTRTGLAELLTLAKGAPVQGQVVAVTPGGTTQIAVGQSLLELTLAKVFQPGTHLTLQTQGTGAEAMLIVRETSPAATFKQAPPASAPLQGGNSEAVAATVRSSPAQPPEARVTAQPAMDAARIPVGNDAGIKPNPGPAASGVMRQLSIGGGEPSVRSQSPPGAPVIRPAIPNPSTLITAPLAKPVIAELLAAGVRSGSVFEARVKGPAASGGVVLQVGDRAVQVPLDLRSEGQPMVRLILQESRQGMRLAMIDTGGGVAKAPTDIPGAQVSGLPGMSLSTPQAMQTAMTRMVQNAVGRQDSVAALISSLAGLKAKVAEMPAPVLRTAGQLLAARVDVAPGKLTGQGLREAIARSGIFAEALAARGVPVAAQVTDMKVLLVNLRNALANWLGKETMPATSPSRTPPPAHGDAPRARGETLPLPPAEIAPKELGRLLQGQAEAALSRLRLMQVASLPEGGGHRADATPQQQPQQWNLELPLMLGRELSIAQFQISRDGGAEHQEPGEREWQMRFALNFEATGEVGAQVALRGGRASVTMWAERAETAAALNEMLPELGDALAAHGLDARHLACRHGVPPGQARRAGQFVDAQT